jgi:probable rRNA maturation factor
MTAEADQDGVGPDPVEVLVEDRRWEDAGIVALANRAAVAVFRHFGRDRLDFEVSLLACDDARIRELNRQFRGMDQPTNVLSWPSGEDEGARPAGERLFLGDMALAFETCTREAERIGLTLEAHVLHLTVHGVLHLLGYDHGSQGEAEEMETLEAKILETLGVKNPYCALDASE